MARPPVLSSADVDAWLSAHPGWAREGEASRLGSEQEASRLGSEREAIARTFSFPDFSTALAFVVRVGLFAEKTDHHPEIAFTWGKATIVFSTHEPKGLTQLDLDGAEHADHAHGGR
jgi:4a-hydroxytetrahydrobiopterin dehydratase